VAIPLDAGFRGCANLGPLMCDEAAPVPWTITDLLDRIPGAWDSAMAGEEDIKAGRHIPLEDLPYDYNGHHDLVE
jgi:hypothetical protein